MDAKQARLWIIKASLIVIALNFTFFLLAPTIGYPLTFEQAVRLIEIISPVFMAYLGSASYFIFSSTQEGPEINIGGDKGMLSLLVKGPVYVFALAALSAMIAFGYSNRAEAVSGSGMSVDILSGSISAILGLLAVTTNVIVAYLFSTGENQNESNDQINTN